MKRFSLPLLVALFFGLTLSAEASLDFSVFQTRGFEGKGELEFNGLEDLVIAPDGNYVVADSNNNRLQVFRPDGSFVKILPTPKPKADAINAVASDTRPANVQKLQSGFRKPVGLAFDSKGLLYATLSTLDVIAVVDYNTGQVIKSIGASGKKEGEFYYPMDIDIDTQDRMAVAEFRNRRVQILNTDGICLKELVYQEETAKGGLNSLAPRGVFWTPEGNLIVTYPNYNQVVCWNVENNSIKWCYGGGQKGYDKGMLNNPSYVINGVDGHFMVTDSLNHRIVEITHDGKFYEHHSRKGSAPGKINSPRGFYLNKDEQMIVADQGNSRIHFFLPGQATIYLKEAKKFALQNDWSNVIQRVDKVLFLQPNNDQAMDLMVNALYFFGDKEFKEKNYDKAEDYYRRVLRYRPDDVNIPQKLDAIFWENNRPIIISVVAGVLGLIGLFVLAWVLKLVFRRLRSSVKQ